MRQLHYPNSIIALGHEVGPFLHHGERIGHCHGTFTMAQKGVINSGMQAKLEAGFAALSAGVERVRVSTIDSLGDTAAGTVLSLEQSLIP